MESDSNRRSSVPGDLPFIRRRSPRRSPTPLISWDDLVKTAELPLTLLVAWLLPRSAWPYLVAVYVRIRQRLGFPRHRRLERSMAEVLVIPGLPSPADLSYELEIHRYLNYCEIMRSRRIPRRSVPYELDGWSHVERSLAAERGAIVLVAHFVHNGLAPKQVFYAKGQPLTHLSRLEHGYSKTRVGMRVLNPVRSGVEDRYLRRRALIRDGSATTAVRQLARALQANQVVSLTAGAWEGSSIVEVPLFGRLYPLATGPFALAKLTGAPVLLLIATRASDGTVHVAITPPLSHGSDHIVDMGREAVERMAPYIRANPGQFRGWAYLHGLDEAT